MHRTATHPASKGLLQLIALSGVVQCSQVAQSRHTDAEALEFSKRILVVIHECLSARKAFLLPHCSLLSALGEYHFETLEWNNNQGLSLKAPGIISESLKAEHCSVHQSYVDPWLIAVSITLYAVYITLQCQLRIGYR